jgi:hypothetical protein
MLYCKRCKKEWPMCWYHWQSDEVVRIDEGEYKCDKCHHAFCEACYLFTFESTETCSVCFEG